MSVYFPQRHITAESGVRIHVCTLAPEMEPSTTCQKGCESGKLSAEFTLDISELSGVTAMPRWNILTAAAHFLSNYSSGDGVVAYLLVEAHGGQARPVGTTVRKDGDKEGGAWVDALSAITERELYSKFTNRRCRSISVPVSPTKVLIPSRCSVLWQKYRQSKNTENANSQSDAKHMSWG